MKKKNKNKKESPDRVTLFEVVPPGIEPGTQGFSVLCSTNWAMAPSFCLFASAKVQENYWLHNILLIFFEKHACISEKTCTFALAFQHKAKSNRDVAQLVAHYVRDVGVGRSSRLIPTKSSKVYRFAALFIYNKTTLYIQRGRSALSQRPHQPDKEQQSD